MVTGGDADMGIQTVLSAVSNLREVRNGRWMACCPAHNDNRPSLEIRELEDGRILLHCFAGCSIQEVLAAMGIDFSELFPPNTINLKHIGANKFDAHKTIHSLSDDILVALTASRMLIRGEMLTETDINRLTLAVGRFQEARTLVRGAKR